MLRFLGALLVVISGWGVGFWLNLKKSIRISQLRAIIRYLQSMAGELSLTRAPMCEIANDLACRREFSTLTFAQNCIVDDGNHDFSVVFLQAVKKLSPWAQPEVAPYLLQLCDRLGGAPLDTQLSAIEACTIRLLDILDDMQSRKKRLAGLYNSVGALGGAAVVILLW